MRSYGSTTRGGSWSGAHVPLPTTPVVHQRPHITQLAHAADRAPTVVLSKDPGPVRPRSGSMAEKHQNAMRLHREGLYPNAIAREVGVTPRAVRNWIEAAGLKAHRGVSGGQKGQGAIPAEQAKRIVDLYQPGVSVNSIAKEVGLSRITVLKYLHLAGIEVTRAKHTARRPPQPTDDTPKTCAHCGNTFTRRDDEKPGGWRARTTCDRTCAAHLVAKARRANREAAA